MKSPFPLEISGVGAFCRGAWAGIVHILEPLGILLQSLTACAPSYAPVCGADWYSSSRDTSESVSRVRMGGVCGHVSICARVMPSAEAGQAHCARSMHTPIWPFTIVGVGVVGFSPAGAHAHTGESTAPVRGWTAVSLVPSAVDNASGVGSSVNT